MSYKKEIILNSFQELVFESFGRSIERIAELKADASERKIYRIFCDGKTCIGVYNENTGENRAFVSFSRTFRKLNFRVPEIINVGVDELFYIEEDLGDMTLFGYSAGTESSKNLFEYYKCAMCDLTDFQIKAKDEIDYGHCYQTKLFDDIVLESDIQKFSGYYLKQFGRGKIKDADVSKIRRELSGIISKPPNGFFLYRDFQPRNIMIKDDRLYYIDYQSGRKGPLQYDVASFLYSGSIRLSEAERVILLEHYLKIISDYVKYDPDEFKHSFYYFVFARLLQVLGSYAYIYEKRSDEKMIAKISGAIDKMEGIKMYIESKGIKKFIEELTGSYTDFIHT
ncbi:MAG: phosphotransferase [Ignavibacteria bacterium]|nr:phosphotransferase [Ignavibacteria bacterium]